MNFGISKDEAELLESSDNDSPPLVAPKKDAKPLQSNQLKANFVKGKKQTEDKTEKKNQLAVPQKMTTRKESASMKEAESKQESRKGSVSQKEPSNKNSRKASEAQDKSKDKQKAQKNQPPQKPQSQEKSQKPAPKQAEKPVQKQPEKPVAKVAAKTAAKPEAHAPAQKASKNIEPESLSQSSEVEEEQEEKPTPKAQPAQKAQAKPQAQPAKQQPQKSAPAQKQAEKLKHVAEKKISEDIDSSEEKEQKKVKTTTVAAKDNKPLLAQKAPAVQHTAKPAEKAKDVKQAPAKPAPANGIHNKNQKKEQQVIKSESEMEEEKQEEEEEQEEAQAEEAAEEQEEEAAEQNEEFIEEAPAQPAKKEKEPYKPKEKWSQKQNQYNENLFELFFQGAPFDATEDDLKAHFKKCPDLAQIKLIKREDGASKGRGFLKFSSEKGMNAALALNGAQFKGRSLIIENTKAAGDRPGQTASGFRNNFGENQGKESASVIVRNLPFAIEEDELKTAFEGCGQIRNVRIIRDEQNQPRGFGFVDFYEIDSAKNALKKTGQKFNGRPINVQYSIPRDDRSGGNGGNQRDFGNKGPRGFGGNKSADPKKGFIGESKMKVVELE